MACLIFCDLLRFLSRFLCTKKPGPKVRLETEPGCADGGQRRSGGGVFAPQPMPPVASKFPTALQKTQSPQVAVKMTEDQAKIYEAGDGIGHQTNKQKKHTY